MYTDKINEKLIPLLKEHGMKNPTTYGEVFDWITKKFNVYITIEPYWDMADEIVVDDYFDWTVVKIGNVTTDFGNGHALHWKWAADEAIKEVLFCYI